MRSLSRRAIFRLAIVAALVGFELHAQAPLRLSAERLARIDRTMREYVDKGQVAGVVTLVLQNGRVAHQGVVGWADKAADRRMTANTLFRIASQTKAVTSVAAMILIEEGKLGLNDPVSRFLPSFASTSVATRSDTGRVVAPARRAITIKDLLTHTAGISYGTEPHLAPLYQAKGLGPAAGNGWYTADKDEPICETMDRLGTLPFAAQPGEAWVYGYNTDILGCVVERVSGQTLEEFFRDRIFRPLGMTETRFFLPPDQAARLATVYRPADGGLVPSDTGARGQGHYVEGPRRSFAGGAGLVSTAGDYARFLQMLLDGGAAGRTRILSPTMVRLMTTNQVGTLFGRDGVGFGLGFQTTDRFGGGGSPLSAGSFGWGGAYQTYYSVDPVQKLVLVLMTQNLPSVPVDLSGRFVNLVYQALLPSPAGR